MDAKCNQIQEFILYEFKLSQNIEETTKALIQVRERNPVHSVSIKLT